MVTMFLIFDYTSEYKKRIEISENFNDYGVLIFQITDFTLLTTSIGVLFYLLAQQEKFMNSKETFRKERCLLLTILIVFDLSFVIRALYDDVLAEDLRSKGKDFANTVLVTFTGTVCDFIPISLILYLHGQNFETIQQEGLQLSSRAESSCRNSTSKSLFDQLNYNCQRNASIMSEKEKPISITILDESARDIHRMNRKSGHSTTQSLVLQTKEFGKESSCGLKQSQSDRTIDLDSRFNGLVRGERA